MVPCQVGRVGGHLALAEPVLNARRLDELIWECQVQGLGGRGKREIYRRLMKPVLEACRAALERTPEPDRVSLAPDHIYLVFSEGTPPPAITPDGLAGGSWPGFEIRFRPFCLRSLLPASVEGQAKRLEWLQATTLQRFAGLIYQSFGGACHEEGCPEDSNYTPTPQLGGKANNALKELLVPDGQAGQVKSLDELLEAAFAVEAAPVERRKQKPAQEATLRTVPGWNPGNAKPAAPATPRKVADKTPRPLRWGRLAGIGGVLAVGLGTVVWLARREDTPPPTPPPVLSALPPNPATTLPSKDTSPAPPAIPTPPTPTPPTANPLEEAARLSDAGQKGEAIRLLLDAAAANPAGALPLFEAAAALDSPVALIKLAPLKAASNPRDAIAPYLKAWQLIQRRTAQPTAAYSAESATAFAELKRLAAGDALLAMAREPGLSPLRPEGIACHVAAWEAYRQGGAAGPADAAKAAGIAPALKKESDAQLASKRAEAIAGYLAAIQCGSRSASLAITAEVFETASAAEKAQIRSALNTAADAGNPIAMTALVNLISPDSTNPTELTRRTTLLAKAVSLNNPDALFLQAQSAFGDSGPFGGTSTASSSATEAAYNQLLKAASAGHESAFRMVKGASSQGKLTAAQQQVFTGIEQKKLAGTLPKLN